MLRFRIRPHVPCCGLLCTLALAALAVLAADTEARVAAVTLLLTSMLLLFFSLREYVLAVSALLAAIDQSCPGSSTDPNQQSGQE